MMEKEMICEMEAISLMDEPAETCRNGGREGRPLGESSASSSSIGPQRTAARLGSKHFDPLQGGHCQVRARASRTRDGCPICRFRRKKCDERPGSCRNCADLSIQCLGYYPNGKRPTWATKEVVTFIRITIKEFLRSKGKLRGAKKEAEFVTISTAGALSDHKDFDDVLDLEPLIRQKFPHISSEFPSSLASSFIMTRNDATKTLSMQRKVITYPDDQKLLEDFLDNILQLQYLMKSSEVVRRILWPILQNQSSAAAQAAIVLVKMFHLSVKYDFPVEQDAHLVESMDQIIRSICSKQISGNLMQDDAIAALFLVSAFLFAGGHCPQAEYEATQRYLLQYARGWIAAGVFRPQMIHDEADILILQVSIWFGLVSSVTFQKPTEFGDFIDALYDPFYIRADNVDATDTTAQAMCTTSPSTSDSVFSSIESPSLSISTRGTVGPFINSNRPLLHPPLDSNLHGIMQSAAEPLQPHLVNLEMWFPGEHLGTPADPWSGLESGLSVLPNVPSTSTSGLENPAPMCHWEDFMQGSPAAGTSPMHYDLQQVLSSLGPNSKVSHVQSSGLFTMIDTMGASGRVCWAIHKTCALQHWIDQEGPAMTHRERIRRSDDIYSALEQERRDFPSIISEGSYDSLEDEQKWARHLAASVFLEGGYLYLDSSVELDNFAAKSVRDSVGGTFVALKKVQCTFANLPVLRSLYFPIFLCGVFVDVEAREDIRAMLSPSTCGGNSRSVFRAQIGNGGSVLQLLEDIWKKNSEAYSKRERIIWREDLRRSGILLI